MKLQVSENTVINNLRDYPEDVVERLRSALTTGTQVQPDPHRKDFYDLNSGSQTFYIHVAPTGKVWLLGSWRKNDPTAAPERLEPSLA